MRIVLLIAALISCIPVTTQTLPEEANWRSCTVVSQAGRQVFPRKYLTYAIDPADLGARLCQTANTLTLTLPDPGGKMQRFLLRPSRTMHPDLATAYPSIRCFDAAGIDDPHATGKIDWNEFGFHAMILRPQGDYYIDPFSTNEKGHYIVYARSEFRKKAGHIFEEAEILPAPGASFRVRQQQSSSPYCAGDTILNYRLAIACTHEYAKAATGQQNPTMVQALSKIVLTINRVNAVYEKEAALRLVLVPTTTAVIFTSAASDPFNGNNNVLLLVKESQKVIDSAITEAKYDIGHTLSTSNGGLAFIGSLCEKLSKAQGCSGSTTPVGDPFDIDYVAHELGHQLGAAHTFNALTGSCNGNRSPATAVEPGSGVTIMGYAGICGYNDLANHSLPYLHAVSYDEIMINTRIGSGNVCASPEATGNKSPVVIPMVKKQVIPRGTPFVLTGNATDPDGDPLTYSWEEVSAAEQSANWNSDAKPYFRTYAPALSPTRFFPSEQVIRNGNYQGTKGEYLSSKPQHLAFRFTARDNRTGGGGICSDSTVVQMAASGPFSVTMPNGGETIWPQRAVREVLWDVNGTDAGDVNCDFVNIYCTVDDGVTYTLLVQGTANDGKENIIVPAVDDSKMLCRVKVESVGNIFYDASNETFIISADTTVGLNEPAWPGSELTIWPNPSEVVMAYRHTSSSANTLVLSVLDLSGRAIMCEQQGAASVQQGTLDISALAQGMYVVEAVCGIQRSRQKLIKQ